MRYLICFSYDGSLFYGYQVQDGLRTVEGEIEKVLTSINGNNFVKVVASGRTDRGVHAINQMAHFDMDKDIDIIKLKRAMNSLLPSDIYVKSVRKVDNDFHARYNALKKEYTYILNMGDYNPLERNYVYQYNKSLDIDSIRSSLKYLEGTHNFKSFTSSSLKIDSYERTIYFIKLDVKEDKLYITFCGNGFLRYMVRNMVGTLISAGERKIKPEDIISILEKEDRKSAFKTAPSEGLYLKSVFY